MTKKSKIENLKPFKKGEDKRRNINGRPKKIPELQVLLADVLGEQKDGIDAAKDILMALRAKATKGDVRAAEVLLNRAYGMPKQAIDMKAEVETVDVSQLTPEQIEKLLEAKKILNG